MTLKMYMATEELHTKQVKYKRDCKSMLENKVLE